MDGTGIVAVLLTLTSCFMTSETVQRQIRRQFQRIKCLRMTLINVFCNVFQCNTAAIFSNIRCTLSVLSEYPQRYR